jgi:hypothetical protein
MSVLFYRVSFVPAWIFADICSSDIGVLISRLVSTVTRDSYSTLITPQRNSAMQVSRSILWIESAPYYYQHSVRIFMLLAVFAEHISIDLFV